MITSCFFLSVVLTAQWRSSWLAAVVSGVFYTL